MRASNTTCGNFGGTCRDCTTSGQTCNNGMCRTPRTQGDAGH
jgi:hypothetical protein